MRLHKLIEAITTTGLTVPGLAPYHNVRALLTGWTDKLNVAQHFYVNNLTEEYRDLVKMDKFGYAIQHIPYPVTTIELDGEDQIANIALLYKQPPTYKLSTTEQYCYSLKLFIQDRQVGVIHSAPYYLDILLDTAKETLSVYFQEELFNLDPSFTQEQRAEHAASYDFVVKQVWLFLAALNCANITTKVVPAPAKLNKARAKSKRPLMREYKVLELDLGHKETLEYADEEELKRNGSQKRLHFRRGHVRRLTSGTTVWVSHCLVGQKKLGLIDKEYTVVAPA